MPKEVQGRKVSNLPDWRLPGLLDVVPLRLTGIPGLQFVVSKFDEFDEFRKLDERL